jgi:formamidopyrimidine-DNA glycosylase
MRLSFSDGSCLTVITKLWGAMELHPVGEEQERECIRDMRPTPVDPEFSLEYFSGLIDDVSGPGGRSAKSLLTQEQLIPGIGNAIAQDILFAAGLHPRTPVGGLAAAARQRLYAAIVTTIRIAIEAGGRADEYDLYGAHGRYVRRMDKSALARPCPLCAGAIEKIQYLGGACYLCPACQPLGCRTPLRAVGRWSEPWT